MRKFVAAFTGFIRAQNGVAALEFALLLPLLLIMLLGSVELQRYMRMDRQLSLASENIAASIAQRQASDPRALHFEFDALPHLFPPSLDGPLPWYSMVVHQFTNIAFKPSVAGCTQNCTYTANVAWVWPYYDTAFGVGNLKRNCGTLSPEAPGASPSGATIPAAMFGPGSIVVVDLGYQYKPLFGSALLPPVNLFKQGYANARFASPSISFPKDNLNNAAVRCSGY